MTSCKAQLLAVAVLLLLSQAAARSSAARELLQEESQATPGDPAPCPPGQGLTRCNGACVNTTSDVDNCGACNNTCSPGFQCVRSACTCPLNNIVCTVDDQLTCVSNASACLTCLAPEPVIEYTCRATVIPTALTTSNGCDPEGRPCGDAGSGVSTYCSTDGQLDISASAFCACDPTRACAPFAYCSFTTGKLCFETCCDRDGTINIQGSSLSTCEEDPGCRCGGTDDLYLFEGAPPAVIDATTPALAFNQPVVNYVGQCTADQCFQLCENNGVIRTSTVASSLTFTSLEPCPAGTETLSSRIISCGEAP